MSPSLLDMPEVVLSKIMEDIGIKAIMNLRKVCHDSRNFIDDVIPDANLEKIRVNICDTILSYQFPGVTYSIEYLKHEGGCLVMNIRRNQILLKNEDVLTVCMKDFEIILGHQKSILKDFTLTGKFGKNVDVRIMENLQRILSSRGHPLKVEKFSASFLDQSQLISILPLLDSKTLNTLEVCFSQTQSEIDQLVKSDQWKNIKHIVFTNFVDLKYIQYFTHFSTVDVSFNSDQFPNLALLKNLFLLSSGFEVIKIKPTNFDMNDIQRSIALLGQPILEVNTDKETKYVWYCRIPNTNQILEISVHNQALRLSEMDIKLSRIEERGVPQGAVIQN